MQNSCVKEEVITRFSLSLKKKLTSELKSNHSPPGIQIPALKKMRRKSKILTRNVRARHSSPSTQVSPIPQVRR